ncbi:MULTISPECIES: CopG family ribbon-helix-helix protein [Brenneria]|uniref:Ribbon-helix-helix protein, CopG family n=1 Tax=Brenneria nigrifluens DSM 30175 = ATCC 13028 TaxID=1121120 RepID=A0A2U1ULV7_9GAMM|nr:MULTISPECIES: CopG family ribbon-helix-helix protein [Brenneria]EHD23848.1 transcriptional regulator, CopG family [Brenneria sp. EniD312]PWC22617.1 ribbon-helix-helix protein, CopG family [Brenneria nigrifluens DSM 30175 = ATCC 13028]QCR06755.1 ribbon-helix-helix protein, CopG family [Brenneria nigrifluens DSM 30175 = ATCC 13028]
MSTSSTTLKIDDNLKERVKKLAASRDRSPHYLMIAAITQYIEREEARESFKQEALDSWREYQETGLHLTGDEVKTWLRGWGTETETDIPECHK